MTELAALYELVGRAGSYAMLRFSAATDDPATGALLQKVQERGAAIETELLFFDLEWQALPDERAEELLRARRHGAVRPPPARVAPPGPAPAERARGARDDRAARHRAAAPGRGCSRSRSRRSRSTWTAASRSSWRCREAVPARPRRAPARRRRDHRGAPARACARARSRSTRCSQEKATEDRLRKFPHWLAARNIENEASDESVEALVDTVRGRYEIARRWYRLKARAARRRPAGRLRPQRKRRHRGGDDRVAGRARPGARHLRVVLPGARRPDHALLRRALDRRARRGPASAAARSPRRRCRRSTRT